MPPLVSVIVPTYNRADYLKECLEAILKQTFFDFELIVVDDGSSDESEAIINSFFTNKVCYLQHTENRGVSAARNTGIAKAQGDLIAFCDSDDLWLPRKLEWQVDFFAQNKDAWLCYGDEIWIRNGQRVNPRKRHQKISGWVFEDCLPLCLVSPSSVMMRRIFFDKVGNFDEDFPACEDYDLWLRASLLCPFHLIERPLITKTGGHEDQLSRKYWGMDRFRIRAIEKCLETGLLSPLQKTAALSMLEKKCRILASGARKRGKEDEALGYIELVERYQTK